MAINYYKYLLFLETSFLGETLKTMNTKNISVLEKSLIKLKEKNGNSKGAYFVARGFLPYFKLTL